MTTKKAAPKAKAARAPRKTTTVNADAKAAKGPGVIDTIVEVLQNGGGTVAEIAEQVAKKTGRDVEKVTATVKIQMNRLEKPKEQGGRKLKIKRQQVEGTNQLHYSA